MSAKCKAKNLFIIVYYKLIQMTVVFEDFAKAFNGVDHITILADFKTLDLITVQFIFSVHVLQARCIRTNCEDVLE